MTDNELRTIVASNLVGSMSAAFILASNKKKDEFLADWLEKYGDINPLEAMYKEAWDKADDLIQYYKGIEINNG